MDAKMEGVWQHASMGGQNRSGSLSTAQRRAVLVGTVMMLCAAAAIVGLGDKNSGEIELDAAWLRTFQPKRGSPAQTKQFLAAMDAGAAAAKDANQFLTPGQPVKAVTQAVEGQNAMSEEFPAGEGGGETVEASQSPASNEEAAESAPTQVTESPTIMQPAPLPQDGVGLVESPVSPQQASAAYAEFPESSPVQHVVVQQPWMQPAHVISGVNQPTHVVVQGMPEHGSAEAPMYVLQRPEAVPEEGDGEGEGEEQPQYVMQRPMATVVGGAVPEEPQQYVMVPAYREQKEEGDLCEEGKRQSPISIEYNIVPEAMPVLGWEVSGGHQGQLRITSVEAMGADARILELVRGEASMTVGGVRYDLRSIHLHTPSEHAVGGQKFDLELQLLHTAPDPSGGPEKQLLVSVLCHQYPESAVILSTLAAKLSGLALDQQGSVDLDLEHFAMQVLGQTEQVSPTSTNAQSYFQYEGSLTTPPCSETATWIVLKNPLRVSLEDLGKISRVVAQPNRPMQALNGRQVLDSHPVA